MTPTPADTLPFDHRAATLLGRCWCPRRDRGVPILLEDGALHELELPTIAHVLQSADPAQVVRASAGTVLVQLEAALDAVGDRTRPHLLPPVDLQPITAWSKESMI